MAVAIFLAVIQLCLSCNADVRPKSKAKIVEDYVLSANFNDRPPKMTQNERILREDFRQDHTGLGAYYGEGEAAERDLVLPGHPPPPPPPPAPPVTPYSVFAVGFISFLILLSALQGSLTTMVTHGHGGLLGALGKPGRRRRSTHADSFLRRFGKRNNGAAALRQERIRDYFNSDLESLPLHKLRHESG